MWSMTITSTFALVTSVVQTPVVLVRWGSTGLALVMYENDDTLYLTPLGVEASASPHRFSPTPHTQQDPNSVRAITPNH